MKYLGLIGIIFVIISFYIITKEPYYYPPSSIVIFGFVLMIIGCVMFIFYSKKRFKNQTKI